MRLHIPKYAQERPFSCCIAASRMILEYYGVIQSEAEIWESILARRKETFKASWGSSFAIEHALHWRALGFETEIYESVQAINGSTTSPGILGRIKEEQVPHRLSDSYARETYTGSRIIATPSLELLRMQIIRKNPVLVVANTKRLYSNAPTNCSHAIVLTGTEKEKALFVDPNDGQQEQTEFKILERAINTYASLGYTYALAITGRMNTKSS